MVGYFCGNSLWSGVNGYIAPTCESLLNVYRKFLGTCTIVKSKGSNQICQRSLNFKVYFHSCRMDRIENFPTDNLCFFFMHQE